MSGPLTVPAGATFMKSDGETVETDPFLKLIADAILAHDPYPEGLQAGQQVINAVWDAARTIEILEWAGLAGTARAAASTRSF